MMASSRGRDRSSPWDGRGFGRIGCLLNQAEEHAIMNRIETEDGSYASARNRKLLAEWAAKAGENEYAEPALNPCQTTAFEFFTDDHLLCEGASIRAVTRLTGVSKTTVTKLVVDAGHAATWYQDRVFRNLDCKRLQVDEIWGFVGAKQKNVATAKRQDEPMGDVW